MGGLEKGCDCFLSKRGDRLTVLTEVCCCALRLGEGEGEGEGFCEGVGLRSLFRDDLVRAEGELDEDGLVLSIEAVGAEKPIEEGDLRFEVDGVEGEGEGESFCGWWESLVSMRMNGLCVGARA